MAKFSLVIVGVLLVVAMAAITDASTTINTYTYQEGLSSCTEPMMQQEMLSHCRMYLTASTGSRQQGSPRAIMLNPAKEHFEFCCMQLKNIGEECMCEGIKMMTNLPAWTQQQMGDQMMTMAQNLPKQCGFMSQRCQLRAFWF